MDKKKEICLPTPLFRDPIYDCPTDPTIIWNHSENMWYLFYTQRRAAAPLVDKSWIHGTAIGVATSQNGSRWLYRGTLEGLEIEQGHNTFWAPEIIYAEGIYHMFVSYITGIPTDWEYPRQMLHYISSNLWNWNFSGRIDLHSERVIDACIYEIEPHLYKMWYKDEDKESKIYAAVSKNLYEWKVLGEEISDCAQEGPNVFEFGGYKWMISDYWNGLAVYRSTDYMNWHRCQDILGDSGIRPLDTGFGHHADILVRDGRAFLFYFCHPFFEEEGGAENLSDSISEANHNKAVIQVAELTLQGEELICDRNREVYWSV